MGVSFGEHVKKIDPKSSAHYFMFQNSLRANFNLGLFEPEKLRKVR